MRTELVAIYTALATFVSHEWVGVFTDSLTSLQAIQRHRTNPDTTSAKHYRHHSILFVASQRSYKKRGCQGSVPLSTNYGVIPT